MDYTSKGAVARRRGHSELVTRPHRFPFLPFHNDDSAPRFMSDIRLHTLPNSRTRNGHSSSRQRQSTATFASAASTSTSSNLASGSHPGSPMPHITTAAAAAAASSSSRRKNGRRRRNEYGDDGEPEEEATLLGEGERGDPGFLHDDEDGEEEGGEGGKPARTGVERVHDAASQVRGCKWPIPSLGFV